MFNITSLIRENIKNLKPYSSARDEFSGEAKVFLDANENSLGSLPSPSGEGLGMRHNRYPDPHQVLLKEAISKLKVIATENIFLGNGSDECIDILYRCFCNPGKDNVIICPPAYGMYEVSAAINDTQIRKATLLENFQLDVNAIINLIDSNTKLIWICSPNNPTGNNIDKDDIKYLLNSFNGLVIIDEAYIDFSTQSSFINELNNYSNLVILQTFSKAWGLASLRLGMAFASAEIIAVLNTVKPPYNISGLTQKLVLEAIQQTKRKDENVKELIQFRIELKANLEKIKIVEKVYQSNANFLLVKVKDANIIYNYLLSKEIVVRNRSNITLCHSSLRITVGTGDENKLLITELINYSNQSL